MTKNSLYKISFPVYLYTRDIFCPARIQLNQYPYTIKTYADWCAFAVIADHEGQCYEVVGGRIECQRNLHRIRWPEFHTV